MERTIRKANLRQLPEILAIYAHARAFMAENGNAAQWGDTYPPEALVREDIMSGHLYVCMEEEQIAGVFYYAKGADPTYTQIDGEWLSEEPYAVVHRIASAADKRGVASFCLNWALEQNGNIRIDTHDDNHPMQGLLAKLGFSYCGRIRLSDGSPRIAYQKTMARNRF